MKMIVCQFLCEDCEDEIPDGTEILIDTPHGFVVLCPVCAEARYDRAHP